MTTSGTTCRGGCRQRPSRWSATPSRDQVSALASGQAGRQARQEGPPAQPACSGPAAALHGAHLPGLAPPGHVPGQQLPQDDALRGRRGQRARSAGSSGALQTPVRFGSPLRPGCRQAGSAPQVQLLRSSEGSLRARSSDPGDACRAVVLWPLPCLAWPCACTAPPWPGRSPCSPASRCRPPWWGDRRRSPQAPAQRAPSARRNVGAGAACRRARG